MIYLDKYSSLIRVLKLTKAMFPRTKKGQVRGNEGIGDCLGGPKKYPT